MNNERPKSTKGIYIDDLTPPVTKLLSDARDLLIKARGYLHDIKYNKDIPGDRVEPCDGLLTCGIGNLHHVIEEWIGVEVRAADREFGESLAFGVRGVGLDMCPRCYVCDSKVRGPGKNAYLNNISAFVKSKEEGEKVVEWFKGTTENIPAHERARLDYRDFEPNWIQVKVGACDNHVHCLNDLARRCANNHGRIRIHDISESRKAEKPEEKPSED